MTELEKLKKLTGESDGELLSLLLEEAEAHVLSYTNRTHMILPLKKPVRDLVIIALNRMGTEGEKGRSEAGENYSFDNAPPQIYTVLDRYRLVRVGNHAYETKPSEGVLPEE